MDVKRAVKVATENARVTVVGSGYWGKNLVRNFHALRALACVCDIREEPLKEAQVKYGVRTTQENAPLSPLESTLTKSLNLKSPGMNTYKKRGVPALRANQGSTRRPPAYD